MIPLGPLVVLGDEATCAGFALAGVDARAPAPAEVPGVFAQALESAAMVVITRRCAAALAPGELRRAVACERPIVVVMPDLFEPDADPGIAARMRAALGIGT